MFSEERVYLSAKKLGGFLSYFYDMKWYSKANFKNSKFCSWNLLVCVEVWEGADKVYGIGSVTLGLLNRTKIIIQTGSSGSSDEIFTL